MTTLLQRGGLNMTFQNLSGDLLVVTLPEQPQLGSELENLHETADKKFDRDVIIDLSHVEMLTSESICDLMILNTTLLGLNRKLILCNLPASIRQVFERTGLDQVFNFADSKAAAMEFLQFVRT